jgi:hypothetical protein
MENDFRYLLRLGALGYIGVSTCHFSLVETIRRE